MPLDNHNQLLANLNNKSFICREVEVAIPSSLTIDDCLIIKKQTEKLTQELVAYVVLLGLFVPE